MNGEFPDPTPPYFFVSHARTRAESQLWRPYQTDWGVVRFFNDLTENVGQLFNFRPGDSAGFLDQESGGGERWQRQLLYAAGTCDVFVALLSPPYLHSVWCAREWDLFSQRRIYSRTGARPDIQSVIIPVRWAPILETPPERIAEIEWFRPVDLPGEIVAEYQKNGVFGLLQTSQDAYRAVVWKLAMRIQKLVASHWVKPFIRTSTKMLRDDFGKGAA